jgi:hypothetical protein
MVTYLTNAFSPNMLSLPADVSFTNVDKNEFCEVIANGVFNAIGHKGTLDLVNSLCGTSLGLNRVAVRVTVGDLIYIIMLAFRVEEGKVLNTEEVKQLHEEGKVLLVKAEIYGDVLKELVTCQGICEEKQYDALAYRAKNGKVVKGQ